MKSFLVSVVVHLPVLAATIPAQTASTRKAADEVETDFIAAAAEILRAGDHIDSLWRSTDISAPASSNHAPTSLRSHSGNRHPPEDGAAPRGGRRALGATADPQVLPNVTNDWRTHDGQG